MSVLLELAMFPTDKGESISAYVTRIISMFHEKGVDYQLTPMGTIIETEGLPEALNLITDAYRQLESDCNRVYATVKLDIRKEGGNRRRRKIESVEKRMGKRPKT